MMLQEVYPWGIPHVEEEERELAKDVHRLAHVVVKFSDSTERGIVVTDEAESSLV